MYNIICHVWLPWLVSLVDGYVCKQLKTSLPDRQLLFSLCVAHASCFFEILIFCGFIYAYIYWFLFTKQERVEVKVWQVSLLNILKNFVFLVIVTWKSIFILSVQFWEVPQISILSRFTQVKVENRFSCIFAFQVTICLLWHHMIMAECNSMNFGI